MLAHWHGLNRIAPGASLYFRTTVLFTCPWNFVYLCTPFHSMKLLKRENKTPRVPQTWYLWYRNATAYAFPIAAPH